MTDEKPFDRELDLLGALHRQTRDRRVDWQDKGQTNWFEAKSGNFLLKIGEIFDPDYPEMPDYSLAIIDASGRTIESISNTSLRAVSDRKTTQGHTPYAALQGIYEMARRKALRVDDVLDSLLENLNAE